MKSNPQCLSGVLRFNLRFSRSLVFGPFFGCLPQNRSVRQFLLTNLVEQNGHYAWRVNLEAISAHLDHIMSFPSFNNTYEGPTLFLGGASSDYIRYPTCIITLELFHFIHVNMEVFYTFNILYLLNSFMCTTPLLHVLYICILCAVFQFFLSVWKLRGSPKFRYAGIMAIRNIESWF